MKEYDVYSGSAYPFPVFQGHQQGLHTGIPGFVGKEKRNRFAGNGRLYPSGLETGAGGKAGPGGGRALCAERGLKAL